MSSADTSSDSLFVDADLKKDFVAVLDGKELERDAEGYRYANGDRVEQAREIDIVFVNNAKKSDSSEGAWFSKLSTSALEGGVVIDETPEEELAEILTALSGAEQELTVDIEPSFFHETLSQWMGHSKGTKTDAPLWDYEFWKAELESEGQKDGAEIFSAQVFRGNSNTPECYRYALSYDEAKNVTEAKWLSERPNLLKSDDESECFSDEGLRISDDELAALLEDADVGQS